MDWAEPMLARARAKAEAEGRAARFLMGDAARTMEPAESYDVVVARHLVWTLVDPATAFADWHRVLRPGGRLLLIDGDFVMPTWITRLRQFFARRSNSGDPAPSPTRTHQSIVSRVHFSGGARAGAVAELLQRSGFAVERIDTDLRQIHRQQARRMSIDKRLDRAAQHRYAILAVRTGQAAGS